MRGLGRSVSLTRDGDHLRSLGHQIAGFVPVQGAGAHPEHLILLHDQDVGLRLDDDQPVDTTGLQAALQQPRTQGWSGVRFGGMEPFDGLFLWLATTLPRFGLLTRTRTDTARDLVDPASPLGTPTLLEGGSFAYLTFRQIDPEPDTFEFGAHGHGPDADTLVEAMNHQIRAWDDDHRHGPGARITIHPAGPPHGEFPRGRVIPKHHTTVIITWP